MSDFSQCNLYDPIIVVKKISLLKGSDGAVVDSRCLGNLCVAQSKWRFFSHKISDDDLHMRVHHFLYGGYTLLQALFLEHLTRTLFLFVFFGFV